MPRRYYSSTAQRTTLSAGINASVTSMSVGAVTGFPSSFPYTLILDQDTLSEEIVEVSARSGTTLTVTRGVDGSTAVAHTAGAPVNHGVSARDFNEPNVFLNEGGTIAAPVLISASSSGNAFEVRQLGAGNAFVVEDSANPDASPFVIDASGNVGIGTSSPSGIFHINSDSSTVVRVFQNTTDSSGPKIYMVKQRGTAVSPTVVAANDSLGDIYFYGYDGAIRQTAALIQGAVDATPGSGDMPGRLAFFTTADGSSSVTERMRIDNAGLITGTGTSLGAWTAYTPTLGGTGWAIGDGTTIASYCQIGKIVHFRARITFGSTSTYGASAEPTISLPVTGRSGTGYSANRTLLALYSDASTGQLFSGIARFANATTITFSYISATSGLLGSVNSTTPFTWASGDILELNGTYEAA